MTFDFENLIGRDQIALIYVAYYGRLPDPGGFAFWNDFYRIETGKGVASQDVALRITDSFLDQTETRSNYPFFTDPAAASQEQIGTFLDQVYLNLFNRAPDNAGRDFWGAQIVNRLDAGQGFSDLLTQIIDGAQGDDISAMDNKLEVGKYYVENIGDGFNLTEASQFAQQTTADDATVQTTTIAIDLVIGSSTASSVDPMAMFVALDGAEASVPALSDTAPDQSAILGISTVPDMDIA